MSRTVLVVDDAAFVRRLMRRILTREGYAVHEAFSGRDAVQKYAELRPDLVTMDLAMPDMSGLDALSAIRESDPDARVVVVTASSRATARAESLLRGASGFVTKPFQPARILDAVRESLNPAHG